MTDCMARFDFELRVMAWELARAVIAAELARRAVSRDVEAPPPPIEISLPAPVEAEAPL